MPALIEQLRAKRKNVYENAKALAGQAANENRAFNESEESRWHQLNAELDSFDKRIGELVDQEKRAKETKDAFDALGAHGQRSTVPSLLPDPSQMSELHRAATSGESLRVETRATVLTSNTGADELATQLELSPREPRRISVAGAMVSQEVSGVEDVKFPKFGDGDAGIVAEGLVKTEYDNITPGSVTPQVITIWLDTTRQNVLTMTNFEQKLRNVLAAKVARREDLLLITTVLGTVGIQTHLGTADAANALLTAAALAANSEVGALPNLAVVHPNDVEDILGTGTISPGSVSDVAGLDLRIHGMQLYPSSHITAGTALVGAWNAAARFVVGIPPIVLVDAISGIKTNAITFLEEEAVNIAVDEPTGFVSVTYGT